VIEEVSNEMPEVTFFKFEIKDDSRIPQSLSISSIPTSMLFKGGQVAMRHSGAMNKAALISLIKENL
jgi:thioredoxin 1